MGKCFLHVDLNWQCNWPYLRPIFFATVAQTPKNLTSIESWTKAGAHTMDGNLPNDLSEVVANDKASIDAGVDHRVGVGAG